MAAHLTPLSSPEGKGDPARWARTLYTHEAQREGRPGGPNFKPGHARVAAAAASRALRRALASRTLGVAEALPARGRVAARIEERMALAIALVRGTMVVLVFAPQLPALLGRARLQARPRLALAGGLAAAGEAAWVLYRVRRRGAITSDTDWVTTDVVFSLLLMLLTSRSVAPDQRNAGLTASLSFTLSSAGLAGLGLGRRPAGLAVPFLLALGWTASVWPDVSVKLISDCLGYVLWYVACALMGRGFRAMAALADRAQAEAEAAWVTAAEQRHLAELAREREQAFRAIHDELLPVVDAVAQQRAEDPRLPAVARRAAAAARDLILGRRSFAEAGLGALLAEVRDEYLDYGLELSPWGGAIEVEPPPELARAVAAATREALRNVHKYAGNLNDITLHAEVTEDGGEIVVRDQGAGFDPRSVTGRGGFARIYPALQRWGGGVQVLSAPQLERGTEVTIWWPAQAPSAPDETSALRVAVPSTAEGAAEEQVRVWRLRAAGLQRFGQKLARRTGAWVSAQISARQGWAGNDGRGKAGDPGRRRRRP